MASTRRWLVLSVPAPPRGEEHLLVEALMRLGGRSVVREGGRYVARIPRTAEGKAEDDSVDHAFLEQARATIRAATTLQDPELRWWWSEEGGEGAPVARHPTTRACLALMEGRVAPGERWLDVGTGTGVLALAAARLGAGEVVALEVDPVAAEVARENLAREGAHDAGGASELATYARRAQGAHRPRIQVLTLRAGPEDLSRLGPFHGIVANIEVGVLMELLAAFGEEKGGRGPAGERPGRGIPSAGAPAPAPAPLHPGGRLIVSGAHRGEGAELVARAGELGLHLLEERMEEGWWAGAFSI
jgi:SAM-dependent methyltransferase